jgi:hypothetical protein
MSIPDELRALEKEIRQIGRESPCYSMIAAELTAFCDLLRLRARIIELERNDE